jgi:hypothetical protein
MAINYDRIPEELRWDRSWCIAGKDENTGRYRAPYGYGRRGLFHVSPVKPEQWSDFESIVEIAAANPPCGIGYVLADTDAYSVIDLDIKDATTEPDHTKWTSQEQIDRYHRIITAFDTYTERSASGLGFHIWVRGKIGDGLKRDGVEIYSRERFIVCTGNVFLDKPIEARQDLLNLLAAEISQASPASHGAFELVEIEPTESDTAIFRRAATADNAEKFIDLCDGNWSGKYPSQSEADLALMSIFTFYSPSNEQCRRMFRLTELGKRAKATKNDVALNRILTVIRARQANAELVDAAAAAAASMLVASLNAPLAPQASAPSTQAQASAPYTIPAQINPPKPLQTSVQFERIPLPEELEGYVPPPLPETETREIMQKTASIDWPPGILGRVARFIYHNSPRPVQEVSIVSALGFAAGVCGKAYCLPQSGLNLYVVLIARSAIGKEAMHSGISTIVKQVADTCSRVTQFIDFTDYASGPALLKAVTANPSFVNVSGEWGRKLRRLSMEDGRDGPMQQLRTVMTNMYQKSGPSSIVGGLGYSDKEKNVGSVSGAAYSMIGESTPGGFYDSLTDTMMEDGFLSRFTIIEYTGERPTANPNIVDTLDEDLKAHLAALAEAALKTTLGSPVYVTQNPEAEALLQAFDLECDTNIRAAGEDESTRQMWNRAHLKASRIAALLASCDDFEIPIINKGHAEWAIAVIRKDIAIMQRRISSGDVGIGDSPREKKILATLQLYLSKPVPESYGVPDKMRVDGIVPRKYLQIVTNKATAFTQHKLGSNAALDLTMKSLADSGYVSEVPRDKMVSGYSFHGKAYRIINLPRFPGGTK